MAKLREAEIRTRLRRARDDAGLSREELAELLTVHPRTIENYEKVRVPWSLMNAWAEATGTTTGWLLHGEDRDKVDPMEDARLARLEDLLVEIRDLLKDQAAPPADEAEEVAQAVEEAAQERAPRRSERGGTRAANEATPEGAGPRTRRAP